MTLVLYDGCFRSSSPTACAACFDGVFTKGLHSAALVYSDLLLQLCDLKLSDLHAGVLHTPASWLNNTQWLRIQNMSVFMNEGLKHAADYRLAAVSATGDRFVRTSTSIAVRIPACAPTAMLPVP